MNGEEDRPQTVVTATGKVAGDVVSGLKNQPMLLAVVVLNVIGIVAALYFLNKIADQADRRFTQLFAYCVEIGERRPP